MQRTSLTLLAAAFGLAAPAAAQRVAFSIDWHGPTISLPDGTGGVSITEGDILTPTTGSGAPMLGLLPTPSILIPHGGGGLGLAPGCIGHPGGTPCHVEVDALSSGFDQPLTPNGFSNGGLWWSTDEYATGIPSGLPPELTTEAPVADSAADVWTNVGGIFGAPLPPFAVPPSGVGAIDGDGLPGGSGYTYPGTGLIEPSPPVFGPARPGDNLDALCLEPTSSPAWYYSLEAPIFDPLGAFPGSPSAPTHGFTGADVLTSIGGFPALFAPGPVLGLNLVGQDDLDALMLWENGSLAFEASQQPYDWNAGVSDMLLFSVRRGSAVIGMPDSIFGIPIEEGDILTAPLATAFGGVSPFPGIFIAAENLGLGAMRTGTAMGNTGDDLDALSTTLAVVVDCDGDGIEDSVAIAMGLVPDTNSNGVPDGCETSTLVTSFCFCSTVAPCGNLYAPGGCRNSTGVGAILSASGSTSVAADDLVLTTTQMAPFSFGLTFMAPNTVGPFTMGDGRRCVGNGIRRYTIVMADGSGTASLGTGIVADSISLFRPSAGSPRVRPGTSSTGTATRAGPAPPATTSATPSPRRLCPEPRRHWPLARGSLPRP